MTTPIGSATMGLRLAQAYGTGASAPARAASAAPPTPPTAAVQPLRAADRVDIAARVGPSNTVRKAAQLVAAVVPGRVDFTVDDARGAAAPQIAAPRPSGPPSSRAPDTTTLSGGPLPFYRAPSDRNAAATAIMLGRTVDVAG